MQAQSVSVGLVFVLVGAGFLLIWVVLRVFVPRLRPVHVPAAASSETNELSSVNHAVFLVHTGGRVDYVNSVAREWFELRESETPNLELMARRIRPSEDFWNLCASEGQARFSLNGRPLEGFSYQIPGATPAMLVSLRRSELTAGLASQGERVAGSALRILSEFSQTISVDVGVMATVQAILENVERLVPADMLEVQMWNQAEQTLTPYRFGSGPGSGRRLERGMPHTPSGYTSLVVEQRQPVLVADAQTDAGIPYQSSGDQKPVRAYIGVPLLAGGELIGTLEAGLNSSEGFAPQDMAILQLLSSQAAVALRNSAMLEEQQQRTAELTGLANLSQAIGSTRESHDLFNRLIQSIAPLFNVEILGFFIYNESRHSLDAQVPFIGLPAQFVELYHVDLQQGSAAEEMFLRQEPLVTEDAMDDDSWSILGFQDYAQAASLRDGVLMPLLSAGRPLGYLQVCNHRQPGQSFTSDELRLLNIIANQAAPIIDNLTLVQQSRLRTQRAEAMRRISSLTSSSATLDEVLRYVIQELSRLLQADAAAVFLLDDERGVLQLQPGSLFGINPEVAEPLARLFVDNTQFRLTVTGSQRSFLSGNLSEDKRVLEIYHSLADALKMESVIIVPLVVRDHGLGEIMLGSRKRDFFNSFDLQTVATVAGQLATAVETTMLMSQTDDDLRRRVDHLTSLTRISRELNTTYELNHLLDVVYSESLRTTGASCGTIMFFEIQPGKEPTITASVGDVPEETLLPVEQTVLQTGEPLLLSDFERGTYLPAHADVQSELVVPISYQGITSGLIHLHANVPGRFDQTSVEVTQSLAMQAAIAFGNFKNYSEQVQRNELLRRRADAMNKLFEIASAVGTEKPLEESLEALAQAIQDVSSFQIVLISIVDPDTQLQRRVAGVGLPLETLNMLKGRQQQWSAVQQVLKPEFKIGQGYFIPYDQRPLLSSDLQLVTVDTGITAQAPNAWNPEDALLFPLSDDHGNAVGLISLDAPRNGLRPDRVMLEVVEIFAAQAALIIRSNRSLNTYRIQAETLRTSLERQEQLLSIGQGTLPTLLHKDLEQMISIRNLDRRARRIRAGLELTEIINRQVDSQSALQALGREMLTRLEMSVSIVAENTVDGPHLLHVLGNIPRGTSPEALFGQRNPLRTSLQTGETMLVMNLEQDDTWRDAPLLTSLHAKGFICLPIIVDGKPLAGILAISPEPMSALTDEDRQVYFQIARQVSIILQNISLLTETRRRLREVNLLLDFSRQLSGLDPDNIIKALLESALRVVTAAHAGAVLVWDEQAAALTLKVAANYANPESLKGIVYRSGEALPGKVYQSRQARRVDEVNFARDYNIPAEHLLRYREATAGRIPVSSLLIPIQTADQILGVLVLDNFNTTAAFSSDDEALLLSLTQQVALALENVRLVQASQERAAQLQAITNVATTMTASLQTGQLISGLLDQLRSILPYDTAILWLRNGDTLSTAAARGFPDNEERIGLTVAAEDSVLLRDMIKTMQAVIVSDVRIDSRFPFLVEPDRLSWMGIPLVSKGQVTGVIALEKTEANYYSFEHSQLITTFASQAAISIDNAQLYEESVRRAAELDQRSQRLALLNRLSSGLSGLLNEDQVLRLTAEELRSAMNATRVSVVTFDRFNVPMQRIVVPISESAPVKAMPKVPIFDHLRESLGVFSTSNIASEPDLDPLAEFLVGMRSLSILPLSSGPNLRALLFVQMMDEVQFSSTEAELARTIANQSATALENARLYQNTVSRAEQLTIINRASFEIGLRMDPEDIYSAIHRAVGQLMVTESFVIALMDEEHGEIDGVYLVDPKGRSPSVRIPLGQGLSGRVIATGEPVLIADMQEVEALGGRTFGEGQPRSIVGVPIMMGGKVLGMLSAQSYQPNSYTVDEQQILSTLANQAAVAIQNARLFAETRRLNEELEKRVAERTAELQREQRGTETLLRILTEVSASLDLDRALNRTLALLNDAIGAEQGSVLMINQQDGTISYRAGYGYVTPIMTEGLKPTSLKVGEGLAGWVIKNRQAVRVPDVRKDKRWIKLPLSTPLHRSVVAAPLVVGEEVIGAIMVFHRKVDYFTPEHMNLVQAIGSQVAVAINNAQLYELIRDQAERLGSMLRGQQVEASRQQAILEAVADGVLVTDPSNGITFLNTSAERILGLKSDQVIGQTLDHFVGLFGKAAQTWMLTIRSWSEDPSSHQIGDTYAEQLTLENGRVVLVHLAPVVWKNEFLGTVSIFRDITHEVEVDRLKSEFVATVSHELRTPMTSIKGYVDILLMGAAGAMNENQTHFLDIVRSNTERLSILVNDLLDISRIEAGRVSLSLQAVDLHELADDIIANLLRRSQEENKPIGMMLDAPPNLPRIRGDIERVRQIMDNLVDNAYHYTPENGQITIHMHRANGAVQVDVKDNGIGIPLSDQDRIFERFYRGEHPLVLATPGTGLGLAIVRQLVTMHGGKIWMDSTGIVGDGSTFSFTLPVYEAEE
jgi:PAS domain S-box-containing protein